MRRFLENLPYTGIVPPEVGLSSSLKAVKKLHLGSRQHTEAHKNDPRVTRLILGPLGRQTQLPASSHDPFGLQHLMEGTENRFQGVPQVEKLAAHLALVIAVPIFLLTREESPQVGIGIGVKECREQVVAKDFPHLLLDLVRQVVAAQVMQVLEVTVNLAGIGQRAVNVVEIADDELRPVDKLVKLLCPVAHRGTIGVIQGEHLLDIGRGDRSCPVGDKLVDRRHTGHETRPDAAGRSDKLMLQIMGEELAAAAVGENKAVVLKALGVEVMSGDLLQEGCIHSIF